MKISTNKKLSENDIYFSYLFIIPISSRYLSFSKSSIICVGIASFDLSKKVILPLVTIEISPIIIIMN
jgi:hypothetical protein